MVRKTGQELEYSLSPIYLQYFKKKRVHTVHSIVIMYTANSNNVVIGNSQLYNPSAIGMMGMRYFYTAN